MFQLALLKLPLCLWLLSRLLLFSLPFAAHKIHAPLLSSLVVVPLLDASQALLETMLLLAPYVFFCCLCFSFLIFMSVKCANTGLACAYSTRPGICLCSDPDYMSTVSTMRTKANSLISPPCIQINTDPCQGATTVTTTTTTMATTTTSATTTRPAQAHRAIVSLIVLVSMLAWI